MTNDDGVDSPGLILLAEALAAHHDIVVAAPARNFSGSGTGIGGFPAGSGVAIWDRSERGYPVYVLDGPPGLAVTAAELGAFGVRPDLVVAGPNAGMNTGHSVIHSGTVGAVLGARTFGRPGLALSLAYSEPWHWETAATIGAKFVDWMLERAESAMTLNVNIPALPIEEVKPARWAHLDDFGYFHLADADLEARLLKFEARESSVDQEPESDTALCRAGHVAVTPLTPVEADRFPTEDPPLSTGI